MPRFAKSWSIIYKVFCHFLNQCGLCINLCVGMTPVVIAVRNTKQNGKAHGDAMGVRLVMKTLKTALIH